LNIHNLFFEAAFHLTTKEVISWFTSQYRNYQQFNLLKHKNFLPSVSVTVSVDYFFQKKIYNCYNTRKTKIFDKNLIEKI